MGAKPERHRLSDGRLFWKFPDLPFDKGEMAGAIYDYYLRMDPATGEIDDKKWAIYPNNSTPNLLTPLMAFLQRVTDQNDARLAELTLRAVQPPNLGQMQADQNRWKARLGFYQATVFSLLQTNPDVSAGSTSEASKQINRFVVEPLFLGWFPNDVEPFASQPPPYSSQPGQSVMDVYMPLTLANQTVISKAALDEAWDLFKKELGDRFKKVIEVLHDRVLIPLGFLPWVAVAAAGIGIVVWFKEKGK